MSKHSTALKAPRTTKHSCADTKAAQPLVRTIRKPRRARNNFAAMGALASAGYLFVVRPWHRRWGTTPIEAQRQLPGDEFVPEPKLNSTHAVTINAPIAQVWQWLVQMGQGRGGFYSYEWVENALGTDIHNADRILPEFQQLKVGDVVPLASSGFGIPVALLERERHLVLNGDSREGGVADTLKLKPGDFANVTWGFYLEALEHGQTRLIERWRADFASSLPNALIYFLFVEPGAFVMSRKMLLGIKQRAEAAAARERALAIFKTPAGREACVAAYDETLRLWSAPYEELDVPTRFGTTHVIASGARHAPPMLLLHAAGNSATEWFANVGALSQHFRVYALDTIGDVNKSVPSALPQDPADYVVWLKDVLDELGIQQADVVGHSYGGWLALNLALHAPERINRVALLAPAASLQPFKRGIELGLRLSHVPLPIQPSASLIVRALLARGNTLDPRLVNQLQQVNLHGSPQMVWPSVFSDEELSQIHVPVLLMLGEQEVIYNPHAAMERALRWLTNVETAWIPNASHLLNIEQPALVNARLVEFLQPMEWNAVESLLVGDALTYPTMN